jgi:hypothetical protein
VSLNKYRKKTYKRKKLHSTRLISIYIDDKGIFNLYKSSAAYKGRGTKALRIPDNCTLSQTNEGLEDVTTLLQPGEDVQLRIV